MALIQVKRGLASALAVATLSSGELGYTTDTKSLYVGDGVTVGALKIAMENAAATFTNVLSPSLQAKSSAGISLKNQSGATCILAGAGGGQGVSTLDGLTVGGALTATAGAVSLGATSVASLTSTGTVSAAVTSNSLVYVVDAQNTSNGASAFAALRAQNDTGATIRATVGSSGNTGVLYGESRANQAEMVSVGASTTVYGSASTGDVIFARAGVAGMRLVFGGLAIGNTALSSSERVRISSGGTPGTPVAGDTLIGNGVVATAGSYRVGANQVVGSRSTGWAAATGTATRTTFATGSVTTAQLAERVKALIDDLITHGLIGA